MRGGVTIRHRASGELATSGVRPEQDGFEWHVFGALQLMWTRRVVDTTLCVDSHT